MTASEPLVRVEQIDHVHFHVPDSREAAEWYRASLGLETIEKYSSDADSGGPLVVSSDSGSTGIALFVGDPVPNTETVAFRTSGAGFLAFEAGFAGTIDHARVDHVYCFSHYFSDPWGNPLELTTYQHEVVRAAT